MMATITSEQVRDIIKKTVPSIDANKIEDGKRLRDYGMDSLDFYNVVLELQGLLGKEIPDADLMELSSINGVKAYFAKHAA